MRNSAPIAPCLLLSGLGILMAYSLGAPHGVERERLLAQLAGVVAGAIAGFLVYRVPIRLLHDASPLLLVVSISLTIAGLLFGREVNGANLYLHLYVSDLGFGIRHGYLSVLLAMVWIARSVRDARTGPGIPWPLLLVLFPGGAMLAAGDRVSFVLLTTIVVLALFVTGVRIRWLVGAMTISLSVMALWLANNPYLWTRFAGFLAPWDRREYEAYSLVQSFVAFERGGLLGVGLGDSRQKLFYLPEAHSDFVLAVLAEELGAVAVLVVILCFVWIGRYGWQAAIRSHTLFSRALATITTAFLVVPVTLHAASVMGLIPTSTFPLPLVSYGRNHLLVFGAAMGVLCRIDRESARMDGMDE